MATAPNSSKTKQNPSAQTQIPESLEAEQTAQPPNTDPASNETTKQTPGQNQTQSQDKAAQSPEERLVKNSPEQTSKPSASESQPEQTPEQVVPEKQEQSSSQPDQQEQTIEQTDQPTQPNQPGETAKPTDQPPLPPWKKFTKHKLFLPIMIIVIIILCIVIFSLLFGKGSSDKNKTAVPTPTPLAIKKVVQPTPVPKKTETLVYGTWTSQSSVVRAIDIGSGAIKTVATFPLSVKKITVLTPNTLLYIDQTDNNDLGARISIYNIQQNQITTDIPADSGYGIDDYILSPDKRYLAIWEVQFSSTTNTLAGGLSRVYSVDLTNPNVTNLLYDENTTTVNQQGQTVATPIHYPRAILDNGTVLTDQLTANGSTGDAGFAYGMSEVDFDGSNKQDISSMTNGTYGSQPTLSPDGKFMLFAGYNGSNGDGTAVKNGSRQALLTPNTIELLDTNSFSRYKLTNLPPSANFTYPNVQWDNQTGNVIITLPSQTGKQMNVYVYDPGKLTAKQLPLPQAGGTQYSYISLLDDNNTLVGIQNTDQSNLGNLGETTAYAYSQLATIDQTGKLSYISVQDPFVQYISILPGDYFKNLPGQ